MTPKLDPALFKRANFPDYFDASKKIKPTCIVLHWWEEPINPRGIDYLIELLARRELSVQFGVLANSDIYQLTPTPDTFCRHAKCANHSAIGIEIEGEGPKDLDNNQKQFEAVLGLVQYLKDLYHIPVDFKVEGEGDNIRFYGVTSHKNVDIYCPNANGKVDVHDEYLARIISQLK